ncbi:MAG: hypothetical protein A3K67_07825 [Euryarchaeota archaeon RBG_16_62_10]|nr:MAG: hypothetical protein A3K67_07825 [Euryarchaeota archaeon RBG_16_62_10]
MKAAAEIAARMPGLTFRLGLGYLRMKRRARRSARLFREGLVEGGIPIELAVELEGDYGSILSIRELVRSMGVMSPRK